MKKTTLLGFLMCAIFGVVYMLSQSTHAVVTGELSLTVNGSIGSCSYATGVTATAIIASFNTGTTTGTFSSDFVCTGLSSSASTLTILSAVLTGPNSYIIPASNVSAGSAGITVFGDTGCQSPVTMTGYNYLNISSAQTILSRNSEGRLCVLTATGVKVSVIVPGASRVGSYSGTLTFTESGW